MKAQRRRPGGLPPLDTITATTPLATNKPTSAGIEAILSPRSTVSNQNRDELTIEELYDERRSLRREWIRFLDSVDSEDEKQSGGKQSSATAAMGDIELCYPTETNASMHNLDDIFSGFSLENEDRNGAEDANEGDFRSLRDQVKYLDGILEEFSDLTSSPTKSKSSSSRGAGRFGVTSPRSTTMKGKDETSRQGDGSSRPGESTASLKLLVENPIEEDPIGAEGLYNNCDTFDDEWEALTRLETELREELQSVSIEMDTQSYRNSRTMDDSQQGESCDDQGDDVVQGELGPGDELKREHLNRPSNTLETPTKNSSEAVSKNFEESMNKNFDHPVVLKPMTPNTAAAISRIRDRRRPEMEESKWNASNSKERLETPTKIELEPSSGLDGTTSTLLPMTPKTAAAVSHIRNRRRSRSEDSPVPSLFSTAFGSNETLDSDDMKDSTKEMGESFTNNFIQSSKAIQKPPRPEEPSASTMILEYVLNTDQYCGPPEACSTVLEEDKQDWDNIAYQVKFNREVYPPEQPMYVVQEKVLSPIAEASDPGKELPTPRNSTHSTAYRFSASELKTHTGEIDEEEILESDETNKMMGEKKSRTAPEFGNDYLTNLAGSPNSDDLSISPVHGDTEDKSSIMDSKEEKTDIDYARSKAVSRPAPVSYTIRVPPFSSRKDPVKTPPKPEALPNKKEEPAQTSEETPCKPISYAVKIPTPKASAAAPSMPNGFIDGIGEQADETTIVPRTPISYAVRIPTPKAPATAPPRPPIPNKAKNDLNARVRAPTTPISYTIRVPAFSPPRAPATAPSKLGVHNFKKRLLRETTPDEAKSSCEEKMEEKSSESRDSVLSFKKSQPDDPTPGHEKSSCEEKMEEKSSESSDSVLNFKKRQSDDPSPDDEKSFCGEKVEETRSESDNFVLPTKSASASTLTDEEIPFDEPVSSSEIDSHVVKLNEILSEESDTTLDPSKDKANEAAISVRKLLTEILSEDDENSENSPLVDKYTSMLVGGESDRVKDSSSSKTGDFMDIPTSPNVPQLPSLSLDTTYSMDKQNIASPVEATQQSPALEPNSKAEIPVAEGLPLVSANLTFELDAASESSTLDLMTISVSVDGEAEKETTKGPGKGWNMPKRPFAKPKDVQELEIMNSESCGSDISPLTSPVNTEDSSEDTSKGHSHHENPDEEKSIEHVLGRVYARTQLGGTLIIDEGLQSSLARIATRAVQDDPNYFQDHLLREGEDANQFGEVEETGTGIEAILTEDEVELTRNGCLDLLSGICCGGPSASPPSPEEVKIIPSEEEVEVVHREKERPNNDSEPEEDESHADESTTLSEENTTSSEEHPEYTNDEKLDKEHPDTTNDVNLDKEDPESTNDDKESSDVVDDIISPTKADGEVIADKESSNVVDDILSPTKAEEEAIATKESSNVADDIISKAKADGEVVARKRTVTFDVPSPEHSDEKATKLPKARLPTLNQQLLDSLASLNQQLLEALYVTRDYAVVSHLTTEGMVGVDLDGVMTHGRDAHWEASSSVMILQGGGVSTAECSVAVVAPGVVLFVYGLVEGGNSFDSGRPAVAVVRVRETRLWTKTAQGRWQNCHVHRSHVADWSSNIVPFRL